MWREYTLFFGKLATLNISEVLVQKPLQKTRLYNIIWVLTVTVWQISLVFYLQLSLLFSFALSCFFNQFFRSLRQSARVCRSRPADVAMDQRAVDWASLWASDKNHFTCTARYLLVEPVLSSPSRNGLELVERGLLSWLWFWRKLHFWTWPGRATESYAGDDYRCAWI